MRNVILTITLIILIAKEATFLTPEEEDEEYDRQMRENVHYTIPNANELLGATFGKWGVPAPSVHLWWKRDRMSEMSKVTHFYSQVTVIDSSKCSYFMTNGFNKGYMGIQQQGKLDQKVVIFSIWDSDSENAELIYHGANVRAGRFGGEGTGVQSFLQYDWNNYTTYHFVIQTEPYYNGRTLFTGWFYRDDIGEWFKQASIAVPVKNQNIYLSGFYSFVEDYCRTGDHRVSLNGPTWVKTGSGWKQAYVAEGTTTKKDALNIRNFAVGQQAGLSTGGPGFANHGMTKLRLEDAKFPSILSKLPEYRVSTHGSRHP